MKVLKDKILVVLSILIILVSFAGCSQNSNSQETKKVQTKTASKPKGETQEEINQKIKSVAIQANFVQLNGHEDEFKVKSYWVEGEVTNVDNTNSVLSMFTVKTAEGNGIGDYDILNFQKVDIKQGDKVKVYGGLNGKSKVGAPELSGNVIEKE